MLSFSKKKKSINSQRRSTSSERKKSSKEKSQEPKTHPHFWESCWSEFHAWYAMLVGLLKLSRYNCV